MTVQKVVVVGQGYVGLPVAMRAVEAGYAVVGLDTDPGRIGRLLGGLSYVDDVRDGAVAAALRGGRYLPSTDYADAAGFDVAVITVPTPLRDGTPDLSYVRDSATELARHLRPSATVILESTTYPGTTDGLVRDLLEAGSGLRAGVDFHLGFSPERIDPGNPQWTFVNTPKVVSGIDGPSLRAVQEFYDTLVEKTVPVAGTREAEMAKLLENTFRHVNIALVNELALLAYDLGVDVWEAIDAAASKPFGFMRFTPGPGVGGHCLPIDPSYLSWEVKRALGRSFRFVELANEVNSQMPGYVVQRVIGALNRSSRSLNGARVLVIGLAYKPNSGDIRESPALRIATMLTERGATVTAVDGHVDPDRVPAPIRLATLTGELVRSVDIVVVLTDHDDVDYRLLRDARAVLDTRNRVRSGSAEVL